MKALISIPSFFLNKHFFSALKQNHEIEIRKVRLITLIGKDAGEFSFDMAIKEMQSGVGGHDWLLMRLDEMLEEAAESGKVTFPIKYRLAKLLNC